MVPLYFVLGMYLEINTINENLHPEPVTSDSGIKVRIRHLKAAAEKAKALGFKQYNVFWIKTMIPSLMAVFKHETEPVMLTIQHSGTKMTNELRTYLSGGGNLETGSRHTCFLLPLPPGSFAQFKRTDSLEELLEAHKLGEAFLKENNHILETVTIEEHKKRYVEGMKETVGNVKKMDAWPFRAAWWGISGRGKMYSKSLREQGEAGISKAG